MPLNASIIRQPLLQEEDRVQMLDLHRRYFDNVCPDAFFRDMAEKDWVIVLQEPSNAIVGFSTIRFVKLAVGDEDCLFLFSGDTVVDRKYRQYGALAGTFGHVMLRMIDEHPDLNCYWYLISKGYRTYRFMPLYFRRFFPTHDTSTPPRYAQRLRAIGKHLFGDTYDVTEGIVRHAGLGDCLNHETHTVPQSRATDPHVRFFLARNPDYTKGDELACIADIAMDNFNRTCRRVIERTAVEWIERDAG